MSCIKGVERRKVRGANSKKNFFARNWTQGKLTISTVKKLIHNFLLMKFSLVIFQSWDSPDSIFQSRGHLYLVCKLEAGTSLSCGLFVLSGKDKSSDVT